MRNSLFVSVALLALLGAAACTDTSAGDGGAGGDGGPQVLDVDPMGDKDAPGAGQSEPDADGPAGPEDATTGNTAEPDTDAVPPLCDAGEVRCAGPKAVEKCSNAGDAWYETTCPVEHGCLDGECVPQVCVPGSSSGECVTPISFEGCNDSGTAIELVECEAPDYCEGGTCIDALCTPKSQICKNFIQLQKCADDGKSWLAGDVCSPGICEDGECISPCDASIKDGSYLGCEYWAVDLDNTGDAQHQIVGVVVSVPSGNAGTPVTITNTATGAVLGPGALGVQDLNVASGQTKVFQLPLGFDIDGSVLTTRTFRIQTTSPVAVHQFNPLNGEDVFTNDASLLLPSNVTGEEYFVMSWPHRADGSKPLRGFATVIATQEGITKVTIRPTAPIVAGTGIAGLQPGKQYLFVLEQGQALNFETEDIQGIDLTGTHVSADRKISVIGGHECANVPLGISACDHLEQQLFPVETWSDEYFADAFQARSPTQVDVWRVMAGDNNLTVTTTPPVPGYEQFILQRGQWLQFASSDSFLVKADGPIMVGHYLTGSSYPGAELVCVDTGIGKDTAIGDPAFTLPVPVKRYLKEYSVLTPEGYAENYFNVIMPLGASIKVDGIPSGGTPEPTQASVQGIEYGILRIEVDPGVHQVTGTEKFGLTAYGYDCDVSYAYPGGLKLQGFNQ